MHVLINTILAGFSRINNFIIDSEPKFNVILKGIIKYVPIFFLVIYASISWVNHYLFRTHALDLGAYTNALWDYSHLQWNDSLAFKPTPENLLADHFDLYLILFSPLLWIFGTYTLLVVQVVFLIWAGITVKRLLEINNITRSYAWIGMLIFYLFFGIFSAVSFDYHSNVIAACVVPAFFQALSKNSIKLSWFWLVFILCGKENLGLWMIFVCAGLIIEFRNNSRVRAHLIAMAAFSAVWFVLVTAFVMPAFSENGAYPHFHYSVLGNTSGEALKFLLLHPIDSIKLFFSNHSFKIEADHVKPEFLQLMLFAGLPLLIIRPAFLIMMVPLFFQKFYHDDFFKWGIYAQYSVEFAPIMAVGVVMAISSVQFRKLRLILFFLALVGNVRATRYLLKEKTRLWQEKTKIDPFRVSHYKRPFPVDEFRIALEVIPDDAVVSCQSNFQPHIALRDRVYQFPDINDAEYIILTDWAGPYPLEKADFDCWMDSLHHSDVWQMTHENQWVSVFSLSGRLESNP